MITTEIGCTRVWCREDNTAYLLHPGCYESLKAAWMRGESFYTGIDCYDDEMVIKLGAVVVISRATPEAMERAAAEAAADRLLDGEEPA